MNDIKSIGIVTPNLYSSQLAYYLINNFNKYLTDHSNIDIVVYTEGYTKACIDPHFAIMAASSAYNHNGPLIATTINLANYILTIGGDLYYYMWDLEFMRGPTANESIFSDVIQSRDLKIICRGQYHSDLIYKTFNLQYQPQICEDFNIEQLLSILNEPIYNNN